MIEPKDGGSAFPKYSITIPPRAEGESPITIAAGYGQGGMSLRDWFAGQALSSQDVQAVLMTLAAPKEMALLISNSAALAYRLADEMIARRTMNDAEFLEHIESQITAVQQERAK